MPDPTNHYTAPIVPIIAQLLSDRSDALLSVTGTVLVVVDFDCCCYSVQMDDNLCVINLADSQGLSDVRHLFQVPYKFVPVFYVAVNVSGMWNLIILSLIMPVFDKFVAQQ